MTTCKINELDITYSRYSQAFQITKHRYLVSVIYSNQGKKSRAVAYTVFSLTKMHPDRQKNHAEKSQP